MSAASRTGAIAIRGFDHVADHAVLEALIAQQEGIGCGRAGWLLGDRGWGQELEPDSSSLDDRLREWFVAEPADPATDAGLSFWERTVTRTGRLSSVLASIL